MLKRLLTRGDHVAIINGSLVISPVSKESVPDQWLKDNKNDLILEILKISGQEGYQFTNYTAGVVRGQCGARLTLYFHGISSGQSVCVHYNVDIKRSRSTKLNQSGEQLPKGRFSVGKRSRFYAFWLSTGLKLPRHLSEFPSVINRLKALIFAGETKTDNRGQLRFSNKIIPLLSVDSNTLNYLVILREGLGKTMGLSGEYLGKYAGEGNGASPVIERATANSKYVSDELRIKIREQRLTDKEIVSQSTEEWLVAYNSR